MGAWGRLEPLCNSKRGRFASAGSYSSRPRNRFEEADGEAFAERRGEASLLLTGAKLELGGGELGRDMECEGEVLPDEMTTGEVLDPVPGTGFAGEGGTLLTCGRDLTPWAGGTRGLS